MWAARPGLALAAASRVMSCQGNMLLSVTEIRMNFSFGLSCEIARRVASELLASCCEQGFHGSAPTHLSNGLDPLLDPGRPAVRELADRAE
jgi:hypothetical protein